MATVTNLEPDALTDGEKEALAVLGKLPDSWSVVANKIIVRPNASTREIDFLVIGERNIFVIEEKAWVGTFTGNQTHWYPSSKNPRPSPLNQADLNGKIVHGTITHSIEGLDSIQDYFVHPLVLLTRAESIPNIPDDPRVKKSVVLLSDVLDYLEEKDIHNGSPWFKLHSQNVWTYLTGLKGRVKTPNKYGPYVVSGDPKTRPGVKYWEATHEYTDEKRILTVHDLTSPFKENRAFYLNEYQSIKSISTLNLTPSVYDPIQDNQDDRYFVIPSDLPTGVSLQEINPEFERELSIFKQSLKSIEKIHKKNIIHRSITPDAIYVTDQDTEPQVQFTEFYAARSSTEGTISQYLDDLSIEDPYAAPELKFGYQSATPASDLYSLCLVFLERILDTPLEQIKNEHFEISLPDINLPDPEKEMLLSIFEQILKSTIKLRPSVSEVVHLLEPISEKSSASDIDMTDYFRQPDSSEIVYRDGTITDTYITDNFRQPDSSQIVNPEGTAKDENVNQPDEKVLAGKISQTVEHDPFWINVESTEGEPNWHRLGGKSLLVGRDSDCDIQIEDTQISRRHANIEISNGSIIIVDLDSTNGTYVNGHRINRVANIDDNSLIRMGNATVTIRSGKVNSPSYSSNVSLEVLNGEHKGKSIVVSQNGTVVGRSPTCGLLLPDSVVSRMHAIISYEYSFPDSTEKFFIEDLSSRNGTKIDDQPIHKSEIRNGTLKFGTIEMNCKIVCNNT